MRVRVLSKRFGVVLRLALTARTMRALGAVAALLTGRRLRAWNQLQSAAADNPSYYLNWIALTEPALVARRIGDVSSKPEHVKRIAVVLFAGENAAAAAASQHSVAIALGASTPVILRDADPRKTQTALAATGADWMLPLRAGDLIGPALRDVLNRVETHFAAFYWDEDTIHSAARSRPWTKPHWDPVLFAQFEGLLSSSLLRIDYVLQLWDKYLANATNVESFTEGLSALCRRVADCGACHIPLIMTHRGSQMPRPTLIPTLPPCVWPSVSIVIPTRDLADDLSKCLEGLRHLDYPGRIETLIIDNGSTEPAALALLAQQAELPNVHVLRAPGPFNYSKLNNDTIRIATGELLCFLNNDVVPLDSQWLARMAQQAIKPDVGAVGALLFYPDGTIQHAGVAIGIGGAAGHVQKGLNQQAAALSPWYVATRRVSAVTAACMVVGRDKFLRVGGFDSEAFPVAFNDVDLCLKLDVAGLRNLFVAEAKLVHHESKSRGQDDDPIKRIRLANEVRQLQSRWNTQNFDDFWYSPLLSRSTEQCLLQI